MLHRAIAEVDLVSKIHVECNVTTNDATVFIQCKQTVITVIDMLVKKGFEQEYTIGLSEICVSNL